MFTGQGILKLLSLIRLRWVQLQPDRPSDAVPTTLIVPGQLTWELKLAAWQMATVGDHACFAILRSLPPPVSAPTLPGATSPVSQSAPRWESPYCVCSPAGSPPSRAVSAPPLRAPLSCLLPAGSPESPSPVSAPLLGAPTLGRVCSPLLAPPPPVVGPPGRCERRL